MRTRSRRGCFLFGHERVPTYRIRNTYSSAPRTLTTCPEKNRDPRGSFRRRESFRRPWRSSSATIRPEWKDPWGDSSAIPKTRAVREPSSTGRKRADPRLANPGKFRDTTSRRSPPDPRRKSKRQRTTAFSGLRRPVRSQKSRFLERTPSAILDTFRTERVPSRPAWPTYADRPSRRMRPPMRPRSR